ncbi:MAG: hypothetical protein HY654_10440 [Acidobacteria bacterium]|nr:hypothetical protein [Acidobacteriota bacterium]
MARLLKLLVTLVVLYATWQASLAFWRNYQFRDAIARIAVSNTRRSNEEIHGFVTAAAGQLNIPVVPEEITVAREGGRLIIQARYIDRIPIVPSYSYPYLFTARAEAPILP